MSTKEQLDRIERKLDEYTKLSITNRIDIDWLKGGVKLVVPIIITLVSFMAYELYREVILPEKPVIKKEELHGN